MVFYRKRPAFDCIFRSVGVEMIPKSSDFFVLNYWFNDSMQN